MKSSHNKLVLFLLFISTTFYCTSQEVITAKIVSKVADNLIDIKAIAQNNDETFKDEYSYLLFSLKKGEGGNFSKNTQSGVFSLESNEQKVLTTLKINIQEKEECKVYFYIRKSGNLISKDSVVIVAAESGDKKVIEEDDFEIKGIVIDNAITKLGKDFLDYFYQAYLVSGNQYPFIITIKERPSFGRSSIITLQVDDTKIIEFYSKPDEEYLKGYVKSALQRLKTFDKQRKLLYKDRRI
ncbi:hypothetical protein Lupro_12005 [Lutibacter profundi]|uniref:Curli production assembly/transport component CsgE n=1 Tax=Lutibacter profundi TaxID=1622118 RepID=A0A0X8G8H2_9FLAO|nr:CsgE family curli-type amyloid fiber assembly protein [Lutibacter profundi]AMC11946.1 hypothetical protein Lupro_12005 [Lutibacter profundi]